MLGWAQKGAAVPCFWLLVPHVCGATPWNRAPHIFCRCVCLSVGEPVTEKLPFCGPVEASRLKKPSGSAEAVLSTPPTRDGDSPEERRLDPNARCKVHLRKTPHDQPATTRIAILAQQHTHSSSSPPRSGHSGILPSSGGPKRGGALARTRVRACVPSSKLGARGSTPTFAPSGLTLRSTKTESDHDRRGPRPPSAPLPRLSHVCVLGCPSALRLPPRCRPAPRDESA